jgi:hypothetical protein
LKRKFIGMMNLDAKRRSSLAWGRVLVCDDNLLMADVVAGFLRARALQLRPAG